MDDLEADLGLRRVWYFACDEPGLRCDAFIGNAGDPTGSPDFTRFLNGFT